MKVSRKALWIVPTGALTLLLGVTVALAVSLGQLDDFENSTTQGWSEGNSPNPPTNLSTGGPAGANDNYLQNVSSGDFGAGGRLIMFNRAQWTGDYGSAGVGEIEMDLANFGATTLNMRIALGAGTSWWATTIAAVIPTGGQWQSVTFPINDSDMTQVGGVLSLATVLQNVTEMRILSSQAPDFRGDRIAATVGVDNITAAAGQASGAGEVPCDGPAGLMLSSGLLGTIDLSWGASCEAADTDFGVYEGTLGSPASHLPILCTTGGAQNTTIPMPQGSTFYLIVPSGGGVEGSYGADSSGVPRVQSAAPCAQQQISCTQ